MLEEFSKEATRLNNQVQALITEFEEKHDVCVDALALKHLFMVGERKRTIGIAVDISIQKDTYASITIKA